MVSDKTGQKELISLHIQLVLELSKHTAQREANSKLEISLMHIYLIN